MDGIFNFNIGIMQLEEQFKQLVPPEFGGMHKHMQEQCTKIAENFAIGFAEWCFINKPKYDAGHGFEEVKPITTDRLLEIYKNTL